MLMARQARCSSLAPDEPTPCETKRHGTGCIDNVPFETSPMTSLQLRAYLVEDNPILREHLSGALEELTCVKIVGACGTEEEAQAWLGVHEGGWDLLIVDLFLKSGSGMQLLEQLRRSTVDQKVIVLSNYVNPSVRKRCAQMGVDAVFDKSTEIDGLVDYCALQCSSPRSGPWAG